MELGAGMELTGWNWEQRWSWDGACWMELGAEIELGARMELVEWDWEQRWS